MELQRFSTEELIKKGKEIFYDYLASSEDFYTGEKYEPCTKKYPTVMDMLYKEILDSIDENADRIKMYEEAIEENKGNEPCVKALTEQLEFLKQEREMFLNSNMEEQKKIYKKTKAVDYSRNAVQIPLDKKLNSFYDDLVLEVLFYDDIAVPKGKYKEYKKLKTFEERREFIIANTEVTHMGFAYYRNGNHVATIGILGKLNFNNSRVKNNDLTLLEHKFSDFSSLRLSDTNEIKNNDLKQYIQSKLDLDKETCMEKLADKFVGNDNYQILRDTENPVKYDRDWGWGNQMSDLYIRYICPSTGRVYFNNLNLRNLKLSEYFKEDDYESYIDAWWSINNLGANPNQKAMIRC